VRVVDLDRPGTAGRIASEGAEFRPADLLEPTSLAPALEGGALVVHLAALLLAHGDNDLLARVNRDGTAHLLACARTAGIRRVVHVSSISVQYRRQNAYSRSKREGEDLVRASGLDWTILRPTLAWGDPAAIEHETFHQRVLRPAILPLPGGGRAHKAPVHVDDLAAAFEAALSRPQSVHAEIDLPGSRVLSLADMAREIRASAGRRGPILPVPVLLAAAIARSAPVWRRLGLAPPLDWQTLTGLLEDAAPSIVRARTLLGWTSRPWSARP
jgi:NADH dehydrogenase